MYNNILKRAKEMYPDDEVIFLLKSLPFEESDEHFTLMRNIHLLKNHIEAGMLETTIENLQTELQIAHTPVHIKCNTRNSRVPLFPRNAARFCGEGWSGSGR
jgi:hypothetical protein